MKILLFLVFLCGTCPVVELMNPCIQCQNDQSCKPPACFCCRDELNLPIPLSETPQIVFFTFDDALTDAASRFYRKLFNETRMNPNGCPISMTLFISHQDTIYRNVNDFYKRGMEIASHSVTHSHMSTSNFMEEAKKQKRNLAKLGGIPEHEIVGWRSPFLEPVGDMQPDKLKELGYVYDATLTYSKRKLSDKAPTPFTLDFGWPYDCKVKPCPKRRHLGFWEVPVVSLMDYKHKYDCVYVDGCNNPPPNEASAYQFLMDNFNSYYSTSRVPFGINMHSSWFYIADRLNAMDRFINTLLKMDDVYIVSVDKTIKWLQNPTPLGELHAFEPWKCDHLKARQEAGQTRTHNIPDMGRSNAEIQQMYVQQRLRQIAQMRKEIELRKQRELQLLQQHSNFVNRPWWSAPRRPQHNNNNNNVHGSPFTQEIQNAHVLENTLQETVQEPVKIDETIKSATSVKSPSEEHKSKQNHSTNLKLSKRKQQLDRSPTREEPSIQTQFVPFWQQSQLGSRRIPEAALRSNSHWWNKPIPYVHDFKYKVAYSETTKPPSTEATSPLPTTTSTETPTTTHKPTPPNVHSGVDLFREREIIEQQRRHRLILEQQRMREEQQLREQKEELRKNEERSFLKQQREFGHRPLFSWAQLIQRNSQKR